MIRFLRQQVLKSCYIQGCIRKSSDNCHISVKCFLATVAYVLAGVGSGLELR